jgi:hypothetical protein
MERTTDTFIGGVEVGFTSNHFEYCGSTEYVSIDHDIGEVVEASAAYDALVENVLRRKLSERS